jgi:hypothetical protein
MENVKHNGWTNYATWRINLELVSDMQFDEPTTAEEISDMVESILFDNQENSNSHVESYARAFLNDINYHEIADAINFDFE